MEEQLYYQNEGGAQEIELVFWALQNSIRKWAIGKGWEDPEGVNDGEKIALMHSELSEALEGLRHGNPPSDKIPDFNSAEEEFADCIIRILHLAEIKGLKIGEAIVAKMLYNDTRPHKHGGKAF